MRLFAYYMFIVGLNLSGILYASNFFDVYCKDNAEICSTNQNNITIHKPNILFDYMEQINKDMAITCVPLNYHNSSYGGYPNFISISDNNEITLTDCYAYIIYNNTVIDKIITKYYECNKDCPDKGYTLYDNIMYSLKKIADMKNQPVVHAKSNIFIILIIVGIVFGVIFGVINIVRIYRSSKSYKLKPSQRFNIKERDNNLSKKTVLKKDDIVHTTLK